MMQTPQPDRARVQRASLRIGALVGGGSALVITAGVAILVAVLITTAEPGDHRPGPIRDGDRLVVDLDHVLPWVIGLGVLGVFVLALIAWWAARRAVRPLADALAAQRNFVSDASHELRTPLTALTSRIQIAQRRIEDRQALEETLTELRRDAARLDETLTDMLMIAEAAGAPDGRADVAAAMAAAASALEPLAAERRITVNVEAATLAQAAIPAVTLARLLSALLDNALQHAPHDSAIDLTATTAGRSIEIRVRDQGSGIASDDRERVFERFARGGETGRRRGFGLGLALVRETAARFGGTIAIEQTGPGGTTFRLTLPSA
ncbi:HAMP domain-containing sensor histidine kinase [Microbacterium sp.]|uniref:sensor histidine kinase n=1 Tax=Microbacterium sp. TaxID=51671 RepID=UPI0025FB6043|nr:HAMP domain-containing sensor histidine kinase [Microbacterium sp.]